MTPFNFDSKFSPIIGKSNVIISQPCFIDDGLNEPIVFSDYLLFEFSEKQMMLYSTEQSKIISHKCRDHASALKQVPSEEGEQLVLVHRMNLTYEIGTVTEVWVKADEQDRFMTDIIIWDATGKPRLHLRTETDEFEINYIDKFPSSVFELSRDLFYGTVIQVRYSKCSEVR